MVIDDKYKGRKLIELKGYTRLHLKKNLWRWYFNSTISGGDLFQKAANNLVLYTTVNKTTTFYRLLGTVRERKINVHPRVKRMMTMLNLHLRIIVHRTFRDAFNKLKVGRKSKKTVYLERMIEAGERRQKSAIMLWNAEALKRRDEQNKKKGLYAECARIIMEASIGAKRNSFELWRKNAIDFRRIK